jgi:Arc/MetJ-type ribon-helix-helix transcriptional regulator
VTIRTTLSFTDRHHGFLARKVEDGVFASTSAAVAAAVEAMIEDELARDTALAAMSDEIRARMATPIAEHLGLDEAFADARSTIAEARRTTTAGR